MNIYVYKTTYFALLIRCCQCFGLLEVLVKYINSMTGNKLALLYNLRVYIQTFPLVGGQVEDEFSPTRGNICIVTSICTIKFLTLW